MVTRIETIARASLLERLIDLHPASPEEFPPLRVLDLAALKESVRSELERVLNTRCAAHRLEGQALTILDYGVPDISALRPQNAGDRQRLTQLLAQTVAAFEPRLHQVRIRVEPVEAQPYALWVRIDANLVIEHIDEPVSFPVFIQSKSGEASVYASE